MMGTAALLFPVHALIFALAPGLAEELLGARWSGTAPVIRITAIASVLGLLGDIVEPILNAFGRPAAVTAMEAVQSLLLILSVWVLADAYGLPGEAASWLPAITVSQGLALLLLRRLFEHPFRGTLGALAVLAAAAFGGCAAFWIDHAVGGLAGVVLGAATGAVLIGSALLAGERGLGLGLASAAVQLFPQLSGALERLGLVDAATEEASE